MERDLDRDPIKDFVDEVQSESLKTFVRQAKKKGLFVYCAPQRTKLPKGTQWALVFQQPMMQAVRELNGEAIRLLVYFISKLDYENVIMITMKEIAEESGMRIQNVHRGIKVLTEKGYISKEKKGCHNIYKLNPHVGWKGRSKNLSTAKGRVIPIRPNIDKDLPF